MQAIVASRCPFTKDPGTRCCIKVRMVSAEGGKTIPTSRTLGQTWKETRDILIAPFTLGKRRNILFSFLLRCVIEFLSVRMNPADTVSVRFPQRFCHEVKPLPEKTNRSHGWTAKCPETEQMLLADERTGKHAFNSCKSYNAVLTNLSEVPDSFWSCYIFL